MNGDILTKMLEGRALDTAEGMTAALREVIQQIALLGLSRTSFFSRAAFYGGTALRLFHGLDRFSEDMDFSLLAPDDEFDITEYKTQIVDELGAFGLDVSFETREKKVASRVESAFLKANTRTHIMLVGGGKIGASVPANHTIRVKLEIDTDPPQGFETETLYCLRPMPFTARVYKLPDLFAGKMHALLCREWKGRVKGRDWYDFLWYVAKETPLRLAHLEARMRQSGHYLESSPLTDDIFAKILDDRIDHIDVDSARDDARRFMPIGYDISIWSRELFHAAASKIRIC